VWTGVAVAVSGGGAPRVCSVASEVTLRPAAEDELRAYVATGEPLDKAGAYALQGEGRRFVSRVEGSESNVIGLPLDEALALLAEAGLGRD
jgi:septum formation protein